MSFILLCVSVYVCDSELENRSSVLSIKAALLLNEKSAMHSDFFHSKLPVFGCTE